MLYGSKTFRTGLNSALNIFGLRQKQTLICRYIFRILVILGFLKGITTITSLLHFRKYHLNVANTVAPNSVVQAVNDIRTTRENEGVDDKPIIVTHEFA